MYIFDIYVRKLIKINKISREKIREQEEDRKRGGEGGTF